MTNQIPELLHFRRMANVVQLNALCSIACLDDIQTAVSLAVDLYRP